MAAPACKGSAKYLGADRLAKMTLELETLGREQRLQHARIIFGEFQQEIELVIEIFRSEIHSSTS